MPIVNWQNKLHLFNELKQPAIAADEYPELFSLAPESHNIQTHETYSTSTAINTGNDGKFGNDSPNEVTATNFTTPTSMHKTKTCWDVLTPEVRRLWQDNPNGTS